MTEVSPTLFIGSSQETLKVARVAERILREIANVTVWWDGDKYKKRGEFFLDSLLEAAGNYDFALLVFGTDDEISIRDRIQHVPRDNVVFELGIFMSQLGRQRTFVLVPQLSQKEYRVLTDLSGLNTWEYSVTGPEHSIEKSIGPAVESMRHSIGRLGRREMNQDPRTVFHISEQIEQSLRAARAEGRAVVVKNIGLDMEQTWPMVRDHILSVDEVKSVTWKSLMVDWRSRQMCKLWSATVNQSTARRIEESMWKDHAANAARLAQRNVVFECRAYATPPVLHGFLVDQSTAFITLCGIEQGRLLGAPNPYVRLARSKTGPRNQAAEHLIQSFDSWFEYCWERSSRPLQST